MARSIPPGKGKEPGKNGPRKGVGGRPRAPDELKRAFETYVQATQGNFDHLDGQAREFARQFNLLAQDIEVLYEALGIDPDEEISFGDSVGVDGAPGVAGIDGTDGIPGLDGIQGKDGKDGVPGLDGSMGPPGRDQPPGIDGMPGERGAPGIDGLDGGPGLQGVQGIQGPVGPTGVGLDGIDANLPGENPQTARLNTFLVRRYPLGGNVQLDAVYESTDHDLEVSEIFDGDLLSVGLLLDPNDDPFSFFADPQNWVVRDPITTSDGYWDDTFAGGSYLRLKPGVYVYGATWLITADTNQLADVDDDFTQLTWDFVENPNTTSTFNQQYPFFWHNSQGGPELTEVSASNWNTFASWQQSHTGFMVLDEELLVYPGINIHLPGQGAASLALTQFHIALTRITLTQGPAGEQGLVGAPGTDGIDSATGAPVFKTLVYNSANTADDGDQPADYAAFNYQIQRVWGVSEVARSNPIAVDLEVNGVSVGWPVASPTVPAAGGVGTERAPTSARVAKGDKVVVVFSGTGGEEGRAQVKLRVVAT